MRGWAAIYNPELVRKAEGGDAEAQYYLGLCYLYGNGVPKDKKEAAKWYARAAEQGDEPAKKALQKLQPLENVNENARSSMHTKNIEQAPNISNLVFLVRSEKSSGTCFFMKDSTNTYIYSNLHVFYWSTDSVIKNAELRNILIPDYIEVANGYDLMRFKSSDQNGLQMGNLPNIDDEVEAYGNSEGTGVITKNPGKVLGVGDSSIEVSCEIVSGNSGGPIIDRDGRVIGIASFLDKSDEDQWNQGTRYDKTRRFGIRVDQPIKWESVKYSDFKKDSALLQAIDDSLDTIVLCLRSIDHNNMMTTFSLPKTLPSPQRAQTKLDNIVRYHNKYYCNQYTNKRVQDMMAYMCTQLKEATDAVIEDNYTKLNSEWGKKSFDDVKSWKDRVSTLILELRERLNKSL